MQKGYAFDQAKYVKIVTEARMENRDSLSQSSGALPDENGAFSNAALADAQNKYGPKNN